MHILLILLVALCGAANGRPVGYEDIEIKKLREVINSIREDSDTLLKYSDQENGGLRFVVPIDDNEAIVQVSFKSKKVEDTDTDTGVVMTSKNENQPKKAPEDRPSSQPKPVLFEDGGSLGNQPNSLIQKPATSSYRHFDAKDASPPPATFEFPLRLTSSSASRGSVSPVTRFLAVGVPVITFLTLLMAVVSKLIVARQRRRIRPLPFVDLERGECASVPIKEAETQPQQDDVQSADQDVFIISGLAAIDPTVLD